jgi:hypothetical protein
MNLLQNHSEPSSFFSIRLSNQTAKHGMLRTCTDIGIECYIWIRINMYKWNRIQYITIQYQIIEAEQCSCTKFHGCLMGIPVNVRAAETTHQHDVNICENRCPANKVSAMSMVDFKQLRPKQVQRRTKLQANMCVFCASGSEANCLHTSSYYFRSVMKLDVLLPVTSSCW